MIIKSIASYYWTILARTRRPDKPCHFIVLEHNFYMDVRKKKFSSSFFFHHVDKMFCQKWDSNPRPHLWTRTLI